MRKAQFLEEGFEELIRYSDEYPNVRKIILPIIRWVKSRKRFLDCGSGNPITLTNHISKFFDKTYVVEPKKSYRKLYRNRGYILLGSKVEDINVQESHFDLILCSHLFYYIPKEKWLGVIRSLYKSLNFGGVLILILHSENSDTFRHMNRMMNGKLDVSAEELERICKDFHSETITYEGNINIPNREVYDKFMKFLKGACPTSPSAKKFKEVASNYQGINYMSNHGKIILVNKFSP